MRREVEESADAAAGIANRCKRGVGIDPETHVAGDVPNAGIGESGDKVGEFFSSRLKFLRSPLPGWSRFL